MKKAIICILFIALILPVTTRGIERVGTTSFQFLKIPVGVRGIGMGNAFVAGANDASAIYWNPAGLGWANNYEVLLGHVNLPADIQFDNVGVVLPISPTIGTFAVSMGVVSMDDMLIRTAERPEGTGEYMTASDIAVGLSYSRMISNIFTFGITARYIREDLASYISQGIGFDAGLQYQTDFRSLKLGMVIQNFGPDTKFDGSFLNLRTSSGSTGRPEQRGFENAPLPVTFKAGILADMETMLGIDMGEAIKGNIAGQFEHPADNLERVNAGAEFIYNDLFALRGGYNFNYDTDRFTFGFGFKLPIGENYHLNLDYAYADQGDLTDSSSLMNQPHRFSLSFKF
jgi:hypothetical protein